jgi:hypothetical protein
MTDRTYAKLRRLRFGVLVVLIPPGYNGQLEEQTMAVWLGMRPSWWRPWTSWAEAKARREIRRYEHRAPHEWVVETSAEESGERARG